MAVVIPDEVLYSARMTEAELRQEIAVHLFRLGKLRIREATQLSGMDFPRFQFLLASRGIPAPYDVDDLAEELRRLRDLGGSEPAAEITSP